MDQETLFTGSKWSIISILAHAPKSPLELAKIAKTSIANVSQQLRLLEMAGIVASVRIPNRDKGQPRIVYSLVKDTAFLITTTRTYAEKRMVALDHHDLAVLRIFFIADGEMRHTIQKVFWTLEPDLDKIQAMLVDTKQQVIHVMTQDAGLKKKYPQITIKKKGEGEVIIRLSFFAKDDLHTVSQKRLAVIYDPQNFFLKKEINTGVEQ